MWYRVPALVLPILAIGVEATSTTSLSTPATCPFRTVNYITHSLPQQCLTSTRKANVTSSTSEVSAITTADSPSSTHSPTEHAGRSSATPDTYIASSTSDYTSILAENATASTESAPSVSSLVQPEPTATPAGANADGTDEESPLEDGKFLSFEDWKRENLKKAGQSEHVGAGHGIDRETRKRPSIVQDSLDALGDDTEIDLDFSGFVSDGLESIAPAPPRSSPWVEENPGAIKPGHAPRSGVRNKDAGTTCKERFNYASFDCAASVLKTNPEAKSPSAVLGKNKDSYMLNECSAQNKFLILELCDDISIDTIVLANFEFFSSTFRTFRVSVSDKYPVKIDKWKTLGTFEARNTRDVQAFLIENPVIWARYLRIEFLTHYGNEFYCPVSLVRVHGTTMLEDYKHDLQSLQMEDDELESQDSDQSSAEDELVPEAVAEPLLKMNEAVEIETSTPTVEATDIASTDSAPTDSSPDPPESSSTTHALSSLVPETLMPTSPANLSGVFWLTADSEDFGVCNIGDVPTTVKPQLAEPTSSNQNRSPKPAVASSTSFVRSATGTISESSRPSSAIMPSDSGSMLNPEAPDNSTTVKDISSTVGGNTRGNSTKTSSPPTQATPPPPSLKDSSSTVGSNSTKTSSPGTQATPPTPSPTIQESFFKSVQKRLQMLEANSSLSLQYIEEQSRALRDAFHKVEQKQLGKTTSFLEYLNTTVLNELRDFRQQYDQLWQSTVIELELQRERYQQENLAINTRLAVLADELIFQKRMSILQMILILICLGLVIFSRGSLNSYLELPLVQSVLARSPSSRWLSLSNLETPSHSPSVSRSHSTRSARTLHGILKGHQRSASQESVGDTLSPSDIYSPPTPVSFGNSSDEDGNGDNNRLGDPRFDPSLIERPGTSPPILFGTESSPNSETDGDHREDTIDSVLLSPSSPRSDNNPPLLIINDASPPSKRLTWQLPET